MEIFNAEDRKIESLINLEAERVVLGTIITELDAHKQIDNIKSCMFSDRVNKYIYKSIEYLNKNDKPIDIPNIHQILNKKGIDVSITSLTNLSMYSNLYSLKGSIDIINELYIKRNIYEKANRLAAGVVEGEELDKLLYEFEEDVKIENKDDGFNDDIESITNQIFDDLNNDEEEYIKFGVPVLDRIIGGLYKTEVLTIGAKSGVGKTALALFIGLNVLRQNKKVLIISREMSNKHVVQRFITRITGISARKMKNRDLSEEDWKNTTNCLGEINKYDLFVNDKISTISGIKKRVRQIKPDVLIVDYLQLLSSETSSSNREREVAGFSRELKQLALETGASIIQLSQLNDAFNGRPFGETPMRESKAIYHDSNNVVYIHKPITEKDISDFTKEEAIKDTLLEMNIGDSPTKAIEVIVSKCRDGGTAIEKMWYEGNNLSYKEWNF